MQVSTSRLTGVPHVVASLQYWLPATMKLRARARNLRSSLLVPTGTRIASMNTTTLCPGSPLALVLTERLVVLLIEWFSEAGLHEWM